MMLIVQTDDINCIVFDCPHCDLRMPALAAAEEGRVADLSQVIFMLDKAKAGRKHMENENAMNKPFQFLMRDWVIKELL